MAPSSKGLGYRPFKAMMSGSSPTGVTNFTLYNGNYDLSSVNA
jgi:hypothetical protein